jgi:hypothetical protein
MDKSIREQIAAEALKANAAGCWDGRKSAVALGQKLKVTSTITVLRIAEAAIAKATGGAT